MALQAPTPAQPWQAERQQIITPGCQVAVWKAAGWQQGSLRRYWLSLPLTGHSVPHQHLHTFTDQTLDRKLPLFLSFFLPLSILKSAFVPGKSSPMQISPDKGRVWPQYRAHCCTKTVMAAAQMFVFRNGYIKKENMYLRS